MKFLSSIFFILLSVVTAHEIGWDPEDGQCATTKFISGTCGSSATIELEMTLPWITDAGEGNHFPSNVCFEVADGSCPNPVVDVLFMGNFNEDDEFLGISYDGGDPAICHGGDYCRSWGSCPNASALVTESVWAEGEIHMFSLADITDNPGDWGCQIPYIHGADIGWLSLLKLQVTVTCDEASCIIDELDECFCSSQIAASRNETVQALEDCFCSEEITESTESTNDAIQTSQSATIDALDTCFCTEEITDSKEEIMDKVKDNKKLLNDIIAILLRDSSDSSGSAELMAAKTMTDGQMEGNDDSSKVIQFTLGTSTEFTVALSVFVVALFVVVGVCWFYKSKK